MDTRNLRNSSNDRSLVEEMRTRKSVIAVLCALMISTVFLWTNPCVADMAYIVTVMPDGGGLHNGSQISMPYADVRINITNTLDCVIVNQSAAFEIFTNQTQNATLAFVYPYFLNPVGDMRIYANETEIEYTLLTWDELLESTFSNDSDIATNYWHYTTIHANLSCFEVSLTANTTTFFHVLSNYIFTIDHIATLEGRDHWEYQYIFGSARTFDGDTLQRIHIHLVEVEPFSSKSFEPEEYLTLTESRNISDAIWEFNVSSMEGNYNQFSFDTPFTSTTTIYDFSNSFGVVLIAVSLAFIMIAAILIRRKLA